MKILSPLQSFQIKSYLKLIKAKKSKAIAKSLPSDHSVLDKLNSAIDDTNDDLIASKYFESNETSSLINKQTWSLSFFFIGISSLPHHFEEFSTILTENKLDFYFLGVSESRIKLNGTTIISIQLPGYNLEYTPTERSNGGTLLYIKKHKIQLWKRPSNTQAKRAWINFHRKKSKGLRAYRRMHLQTSLNGSLWT